jgi:hypothetical protein
MLVFKFWTAMNVSMLIASNPPNWNPDGDLNHDGVVGNSRTHPYSYAIYLKMILMT